jgi:DNA-directed RNA polymerase sigma subunit (sigma70/sigma32)
MTAYAGRERREGSRNDYLPIEDYSKEVDDGELPAEVDRLADILSRWRKSRDVRKKRMAEVLTARYWDGKIFKEIGRSLGVSKQRTHDIHDDALVLLRTAISA